MIKIKKYLPGQSVQLLSKKTLVAAGYEDNNDKNDFLNLLAGKIVTIDQSFENGQIYTCKEYPGIAIYKVFIECTVETSFTFVDISKMINDISTSEAARKISIRVLAKLNPLLREQYKDYIAC